MMKMTRIAAGVVTGSICAAVFAGCGESLEAGAKAPARGASNASSVGDTHRELVTRLAAPLIEARVVPGLVVGVWDDGRTEVHAFGQISLTQDQLPTGDTVFEIGSITKVFTGLLLADAVKRGEVKLDDPLSAVLPAGVGSPKFKSVEISLRNLATHTSGLPRLPLNMKDTSLNNPYEAYARANLMEFIGRSPVTHAPGTHYEYSNLGVGLLGQLLADRAGKSYDALVRERIAGPLGMTDTMVVLGEAQQGRLAPGSRDGSPMASWGFDALAGAGGVRSTVNDMLKLVGAHLDASKGPLAEVCRAAMVAQGPTPPGANGPMGLGWHYAGDAITLWHNGQTGGYSAAMFIAPSIRRGVVVLSNGASDAVDQLGERIIQGLYGMKVQPPQVKKDVDVPPEALEKLTGEYVSPLGFALTVTRRDTQLFVQVTGQEALRVFAQSPTEFFYRVVEAKLEFEVDPAKDKATKVTLHQDGRSMPCERKR